MANGKNCSRAAQRRWPNRKSHIANLIPEEKERAPKPENRKPRSTAARLQLPHKARGARIVNHECPDNPSLCPDYPFPLAPCLVIINGVHQFFFKSVRDRAEQEE
jgi:hypothetical protein